MTDQLLRFYFRDLPLRGDLVQLEASWQQMRTRVDYPDAVSQLLGELTAGTVLLAAGLKFSGRLALQIVGQGPVSLAVAECSDTLAIRGTAKWRTLPASASTAELVGQGHLALVLDQSRAGLQNYQGIVPLQGENLAAMLVHYLDSSAQQDSWLMLACNGARIAGLLLQRLPGECSDADAWPRLTQLAGSLTQHELIDLPPEEILHRLFHQEALILGDARAPHFHCACDREKVADMLRLLGREEITQAAEAQDGLDIHCEFCGAAYPFSREDALALFPDTSQQH
jgi:molecular chaperone Hsp33